MLTFLETIWCWFNNNHEAIRTLALVVAGIIGVLFAWWRARIADRQARATELQSKTAEKNHLNEQFKSGVELFTRSEGSAGGNLVTRVGGAATLAEMARLYPHILHVRVMNLFATFLRYNPSRYGGGPDVGKIDFDSPDNREIVDAIDSRTKVQKMAEVEQDFDLEERLSDTAFPLVNGRIKPRNEA